VIALSKNSILTNKSFPDINKSKIDKKLELIENVKYDKLILPRYNAQKVIAFSDFEND